jgi:hypothetical protein
MIDDFFLLAHKNNELHKVCFKAKLINTEYINYTESIANLYNGLLTNIFNESAPKTSDEIKKIYTYKTNDLKIFFKHQIELIDCNNHTGFSKDDFDTLFSKSSIFFLNKKYESIESNNFDGFRYIRIPSLFITESDLAIKKCYTILKYIETNYKSNSDTDFLLLREKNELLATQDVNNIDKLIGVIKKREKLSYILFDIDIDISNALIQLYELKVNKLNTESIVSINKTLSKINSTISMIEKELNLFKN